VRKYYERARTLATSATAKDTYILFVGNLASAFLGFLFTLLIARALSVAEFGIFSAAANLIVIIVSVSDIGISSGLINFVASFWTKGKKNKANQYIKAAFLVRFLTVLVLSSIILIFAPFVSKTFLATSDVKISYWVVAISLALFSWTFFPFVLQAQKRFLAMVSVDIFLGLTRVGIAFLLFLLGALTISGVFGAFSASAVLGTVVGFGLVGITFLRTKPAKKIYSKLLRFSGWLGVNRVISAVSGRLDIQMLAVMAGATATGVYSISSRLALFIVVLTSSLSSVLAPRFASFGDKEKEKVYLKKASLVIIPIIFGIIIWILIAKPFITILFGQKYLSSVPVFRALVASMIPFIITAPAVPAIIYAMKKPVYIGVFSFFQIAAIFLINLILIPKIGAFAPTVAFGFVHTILAFYTWTIVIRHYWR